MAKTRKTAEGYAAEPKWQAFGKAYIDAEGNITKACEACGTVTKENVYKHRRENPEFIRWLEDVSTLALGEAVAASDARLTKAGVDGVAIDSKLLRTQDQLYKRTDKIQTKIEVNNSTTINQADALPPEVMKGIAEYIAKNPQVLDKIGQRN